MAKTYDSVVDMTRDLVGSEFAEKLKDDLDQKALATVLMSLRCGADLTQSEMAKKLNTSQARISKLEHSNIDRITVGDLMEYCKALDLNLAIEFHRRKTAVDYVKYHALEMKKYLTALANLAKKDETIEKNVKKFFAETSFNVLSILKDSLDALPNLKIKKTKKAPELKINAHFERVSKNERNAVPA